MKLYPRSHWTPTLPKSNPDWTVGLPYFRFLPEVEFVLPNTSTFYLFENPIPSLQLLLAYAQRETTPDINYNYALSSNTEGVFVLAGYNRTYVNQYPSETCRVLLLLGNNETPTDLLKKNQRDFLNEYPLLPRYVPNPIRSEGFLEPVGTPTPQVHYFDLIYLFSQLGYYQSYNRGVPNEVLTQAIYHYQDDFGLPLTGEYDNWTFNHLMETLYPPDVIRLNPAEYAQA